MKNFKQLMAVLLVFALTYVPAKASSTIAQPAPGVTPHAPIVVSNAVVAAATSSMALLANKTQARTVNSADVASAITAASTLFLHMQETGENAQLEKQILASQTTFVNSGVTEGQLQQQYSAITASGAKITLNQYRNSLITSTANRQQIVATIKTGGMIAVENQLITRLVTLQKTLQANGGTQTKYSLSSMHRFDLASQGHLVRTELTTCGLGAILFGMGACYFPPLGIIAAYYAIVASLGLC